MREIKKCPKCKEEKQVDYFYKNRTKKDGYSDWCKECNKVFKREYRKTHLGQNKNAQKRWMETHKEYYKTYFKTETGKEKRKIFRKTNAGKMVEARYAYKRRTLLKSFLNDLTSSQWEDVKKNQNYTCLHCGRKEPEIKLTMDHIIPVSLNGHNTVSNIQGLCKQCNSRKNNKIDSTAMTALLQAKNLIKQLEGEQ